MLHRPWKCIIEPGLGRELLAVKLCGNRLPLVYVLPPSQAFAISMLPRYIARIISQTSHSAARTGYLMQQRWFNSVGGGLFRAHTLALTSATSFLRTSRVLPGAKNELACLQQKPSSYTVSGSLALRPAALRGQTRMTQMLAREKSLGVSGNEEAVD